jgi:hypothetical protein
MVEALHEEVWDFAEGRPTPTADALLSEIRQRVEAMKRGELADINAMAEELGRVTKENASLQQRIEDREAGMVGVVPSEATQEMDAAAKRAYWTAHDDGRNTDDCIEYAVDAALQAATIRTITPERLDLLEAVAQHAACYVDGWLEDESTDRDCCISDAQYLAARALAESLAAIAKQAEAAEQKQQG